MPPHPSAKRVLKEIKRLEGHINKQKMIPATHRYRNAVILGLLSKALTVARAVCLLVESGFPAEAFGLSRTLIEIYFCVRYISNQDTEARCKTYVDYHARVRQEWQTIIMKRYPNTPPDRITLDDDVLDTAKEFKSKAHWTGSGGQAKLMALEPDELEKDERGEPEKSEFDYDALYFWSSHFVHATVVGIEGHACEPGEVFKVRGRSWVDKKRGNDALFNTLVFLNKIFIRACRAMNEEQPEALQDMYKMISRFAKKVPEKKGYSQMSGLNHAFCTIDWEKLVRVFSALLTPVIGLLAAYIAWQQHKTNKNQFRLALLERRLKVFDSTTELIGKVLRRAKVDSSDLSEFYLDEVYSKASVVHALARWRTTEVQEP